MKAKTLECSNCGAKGRILRGEYDLKELGIPGTVRNIEIMKCTHCGNVDPVIPRLNDLMRVMAFATLCKPCRLKGEDVRFLRTYLGRTGEEFSKLVHVDRATLSKWENNDDPVGDQSDRLIRVLTVALGEGLRERLDEVVARLPQIRASCHSMKIHIDARQMSYEYA